ncbi:MAG TPA: hypothetical protein VKB64_08440 [Gaiellaceae bacterium]|nr:hypothetical protein [Gaiellaceae bacterium]
MRVLALAALCFALLGATSAAGAATPVKGTAPTQLHGFLLRADEPVATSFPRTPSFAWNPVAGALRYQFQLSTSSTFRDSGLLYTASSLSTPVAAPTLTLPWITGNPHALFARVRAIKRSSSTPWSAPFGFDIEPAAAPKPLPSKPGLLRWTPTEGADMYQIWFVDINNPTAKMEMSLTNVLDEREFYTFHSSAGWTGTIRWRIRALRMDSDPAARQNQLPAVTYGPWSSIYSSTNPTSTTGPIKLGDTVSDVIANGDPSSPAHRLMPAFTFSGDTALGGTKAELFRVYVFTDRQCLNRVFTGAIVGGPAYAPRPYGPLALPSSAAAIPAARLTYLRDGSEPDSLTFDGLQVTSTESQPAATPTTAVPADSDSTSTISAPAGPQQLKFSGNLGAPVDLWDTDWPSGGYYWTVVAVAPVSPGAITTATTSASAVGGVSVSAVDASGFAPGDTVLIGDAGNQESATIVTISGGTLGLAAPLKFAHAPGDPIVRTGGNLLYEDLELPQDVCAAGRVARFGKDSEPSLTAAGELFASGLSPSGRLTAGRSSKAFYGYPLVAWMPALGASAYEVQWSKTLYPFRPQPNPQNQGALGTMTLGTSTVLPLPAGTWWYRVRGFNLNLPTGAQQMSWSDPSKIVVAKPKFRVVRGGK